MPFNLSVFLRFILREFKLSLEMGKEKQIFSNSFGGSGTIIFQFDGVIGKQGVVSITQRLFHHRK